MDLFVDLESVLRQMWMTYPTWTELRVYESLIGVLKGAFRFAAVEVYGRCTTEVEVNLVDAAEFWYSGLARLLFDRLKRCRSPVYSERGSFVV